MAYTVEMSDRARQSFERLDKATAQRINAKLNEVSHSSDPFQYVKRLTGIMLFSLRVGDYRVIMDIKRDVLVILVVRVGHRRDVYKTD